MGGGAQMLRCGDMSLQHSRPCSLNKSVIAPCVRRCHVEGTRLLQTWDSQAHRDESSPVIWRNQLRVFACNRKETPAVTLPGGYAGPLLTLSAASRAQLSDPITVACPSHAASGPLLAAHTLNRPAVIVRRRGNRFCDSAVRRYRNPTHASYTSTLPYCPVGCVHHC